MAFHDDLLRQARHLACKERKGAKQASLRRAVSTAYYALFHLLIAEAVSNWSEVDVRGSLARAFDHGTMKNASNQIQNKNKFPFTGENPQTVSRLRAVTMAFAQLQQERHTADYDGTRIWIRSEALEQVDAAMLAFSDWKAIRRKRIAQAYLVSLLVKHRG